MTEGHVPECLLTDKNLQDISNMIGNGWESLAVCLEISQPQLEHIKADHRQVQQQIYNMLLKWRNTGRCNATLTSLLSKMINVPEVTIDWKALQKIFGPVVDDVLRKKTRKETGSYFPINIPGPSENDTQKLFAGLQHDLLSYYREIFFGLQISPLIEEVGHASSSFIDIYVKPILTIVNHQGAQRQSKPVTTFRDIFVRNSEQCKKIYVSSPAGYGKTSFAKYLTLIWCQAHLPVVSGNHWTVEEDVNAMATFKFLFIVFLRDEHEQECDVEIMIQNRILPNLANSIKYAELGLKFLQTLLNTVKCIIILDGLDEWSHPSGCTLNNKRIPHIRARSLCTTLTTSRPWKLDVLGLKPGEIDQKLELNGLEDGLLKDLIYNVVTKLNELHGKSMRADDFEKELRNKKLIDLSRIPVVVMQLLTVWFDNEPLGETQCALYSNMIEFFLKSYCKKKEIVSEMENIEVDDCSRDRQIPKCLQNNMYCKTHMELLSKLATLAHNTLFTDNKESSLVFDRRIAKKYLTDPEIEMSLAVGILTQEKVLGKISIRQSHISFIHKTFQEYLAALYVALSPRIVTIIEEKIKHVCCSIEKILEMSQIFMFLSGLCPGVMVNLHKYLRHTLSKDSMTQVYRDRWEMGRWTDEGEILYHLQDTMENCLLECWLNGHTHVTHLPVWDFFIGPSRLWNDEVKSLVVHNTVCSLCVVGDDFSTDEIEDILDSVNVSNSIQVLELYNVSETFVVQLVSLHKHSLSVRPEDWRQLGRVILFDVRMSCDILCSLVDSILQLPKSVQVLLWDCIIIPGTGDGREYIRSHPRLSVDDDHDDNDGGFILEFHTIKVPTSSTM